jgi:hypothetical protein
MRNIRRSQRWHPILAVAALVWFGIAFTLSMMLAFALPTILTAFAVASIAVALGLLFRPSDRLAAVSAVAGVAFVVLAILYRAGPTSGFQLPNLLIAFEGTVAAVLSFLALRRASQSPNDHA